MVPVRVIGGRFSLTEEKSYVREGTETEGRLYEVVDFSPYVLLGRDMFTKETKVFYPKNYKNLMWV